VTTDDLRTQFSAKYDAVQALSVQPGGPLARVRDVLICPTLETDEISSEEFTAHPPIAGPPFLGFDDEATKPIELGRGMRIDRLSEEDAGLVMNACTPRGHYFAPVRQFGQRFSFVLDVDLDEWRERPFAVDPHGLLSDALTMSRLIRDNGYSLHSAARIADFADSEQTVVWRRAAGGEFAWRLRRDRDWLDWSEGGELRNLLSALWAGAETRPPRVRRAMWRTEYASWLAWADLALPVLVSGLESLLKTDRHPSTGQFTSRVPALASELGFEGITAAFCERMYDARSEWVHGTHVRLFSTGQETEQAMAEGTEEGPDDSAQWRAVADIARVQDVLRRAVRRCIEDADFAAIFAYEDAIRARWPL
jgi:hypothetical protein